MSKTITVDGIKYTPESEAKSPAPKNSKIKIVILQRGWVMIGHWAQKGEMCSLDNAYIIRSWGTSKGLGELATEGKKTNTKLDPVGHVDFHQLTTIATINCDDKLWKHEL